VWRRGANAENPEPWVMARGWLRAQAQVRDCLKQLTAVPDSLNPQVFEVLRRQFRQDSCVNFVVAECAVSYSSRLRHRSHPPMCMMGLPHPGSMMIEASGHVQIYAIRDSRPPAPRAFAFGLS
jgi:hypothetical protein